MFESMIKRIEMTDPENVNDHYIADIMHEKRNWAAKKKIEEEILIECRKDNEKSVRKGVKKLVQAGILKNTGDSISNWILEHLYDINVKPLGEFVAGSRPAEEMPFEEECRRAFISKLHLEPAAGLDLLFGHFLGGCGFFVPGEAQKIERTLETFSQLVFLKSNGLWGQVTSSDDLYTIFFAMLMVYSTWHKKGAAEKDRLGEDFLVKGASGKNNDCTIPTRTLKKYYISMTINVFEPQKVDLSQFKTMILGKHTDDDLEKESRKQYQLWCRQALTPAMHCLRQAMLKSSRVNQAPISYIWTMVHEQYKQISKQVQRRLDLPDLNSITVTLELAGLNLRLANIFNKTDNKKVFNEYATLVSNFWNRFTQKDLSLAKKYKELHQTISTVNTTHEQEQSDGIIVDCISKMAEQWIFSSQRKELEKIQEQFGGKNKDVPYIVAFGRSLQLKKEIYKYTSGSKNEEV
eukprot:UN30157